MPEDRGVTFEDNLDGRAKGNLPSCRVNEERVTPEAITASIKGRKIHATSLGGALKKQARLEKGIRLCSFFG
ncbi:MAG: hypothetical protein AABX11_06220 [Nanoarchaeota archaeon]